MPKDIEDLGAKALATVDEEKEVEIDIEIETQEEVEIESTSIEDPEPTPEEAEAIRTQKKARLAQVMMRGMTNEKLRLTYSKCVPKGYGGKFVRDDDSIIRYKNLGFGFTYTKEAEGLSSTADSRVTVGDVVLMTITLEDLALLKEIRHEKILQNLRKGKDEYKRRSEEHADKGGPAPIDLAPA